MKFKMIVTRFLLLLFMISFTHSAVTEEERVHCLNSNKPLLFKDPFPASEFLNHDFLSISWGLMRGGREHRLLTISSHTDKRVEAPIWQLRVEAPRWQLYQKWGLQLDDPKLNDSGKYKASMVNLVSALGFYHYVNLIIAEPPKLMTKRLAVTKKVSNKTVILTCGTLASLGTPPVQLVWRTSNGTTYNGLIKNGNITLMLSEEEADRTVTCEVMKGSPAMTCVPPGDLPRWGMYKSDRSVGSAELSLSMIIIVVLACAAVIVVGVIVTSLLVKKRRRQNEEAKKENEQGGGGGHQSYPLMIHDDSNPYDKPNANASTYYGGKDRPTSPAGQSTGLYMVSGLNLPQGEKEPIVELPPKKKKLSGSALDNIDIAGRDKGNGKPAGRYAKRGETKDPVVPRSRSDSDSKEPPTPKKRSVFLTESNEALDKITEAVAGGKGSGAERDRGRVGESSV